MEGQSTSSQPPDLLEIHELTLTGPSLRPVIDRMDVKAASYLLSAGKLLKEQIQRSGEAKIYTASGMFFTARHKVVNHTESETSLKRLIAAAGIFCAKKSSEINATSSLAERHGLGRLKTEDPKMYYLYNIGLDHETEESDSEIRPRVVALLGWRRRNKDELFDLNRPGRPKSEPFNDFEEIAMLHLEEHFQNEEQKTRLLEVTRPHIDILKKYTPITNRRRLRGQETKRPRHGFGALMFD